MSETNPKTKPTDLVPSVSIDNLLAQRDAIIERLRTIRQTLNEAQTLGTAALGEAPYKLNLTIYGTHTTIDGEPGLAAMVKALDARFWEFLLDKSGLRTFLDADAREKWAKAVQHDDVPELTYANIQATFSHLYDARGEMFERGVVAIFRNLSWDYKTNSPRMFGKRIILTYAVETGYGSGVTHNGANKLDDLTRVFSVLVGQPEPDHRQAAWRQLHDAQWMKAGGNEVELAFFKLRGFKNGNAHLTFLRTDLVDRLNQILAKHYPNALPPEA